MLQSKEQIGRLDRKITIQYRDSEVGDPNSEKGWIDWAVNVWSKVDEGSGNEEYRDDKNTPYTDAKFTIRYRLGVSETMRILFNSRVYNIRAILFPDRKRFMEIRAESGGEYQEADTAGGFSTGFSPDYDVDV